MRSGGLDNRQLCPPSYTLHPFQAVVGPAGLCAQQKHFTAD